MGAVLKTMTFRPPQYKTYYEGDGRTYIKLNHDNNNNNKVYAYYLDYGHDITVLFCHGNAEDLGSGVIPYASDILCPKLGVNALVFDYSGYGLSEGDCSEENCYLDTEAALNYCLKTLKIKPQNLLLYGRSLGTAMVVHIASKYNKMKFRGCVLQSPLLSCFRVGLPAAPLEPSLPFDIFKSIEKIHLIQCPILIVHGHLDKIIPVYHSRELYRRCKAMVVEFLWLPKAGHNDIETLFAHKFFPRMKKFIFEECLEFIMSSQHDLQSMYYHNNTIVAL